MSKLTKTKTQVTFSRELEMAVDLVQHNYPIYSINQSVELLIAEGVKSYLDKLGMTMQDLIDIELSRSQIRDGHSTMTTNMSQAIQKLKS